MAVDTAWVSALTSLVVGAIALAMAVLALRARGRTGNRRLLFVAAAFGVFVAKSLYSAYNVQTHAVPHDFIELGLSLFDLVIIGLLFLPLVLRDRP